MKHHGWIGVDLDGTLAHYEKWVGPRHIGKPILRMVRRVKQWLKDGQEVRIFTARVSPECGLDAVHARDAIDKWCIEQFGVALPVTHEKDLRTYQIWDDRAVCVERNTGKILGRNLD